MQTQRHVLEFQSVTPYDTLPPRLRLAVHTPIIPILLPTNHVKLLIELTGVPHWVLSDSGDLTTLANPKSAILMIELSASLLRSSPA